MLLKILLKNGFDESQACKSSSITSKEEDKIFWFFLMHSQRWPLHALLHCFLERTLLSFVLPNKNNRLLHDSTKSDVQAILDEWAAVASNY
jgi:hypothetical protein